MKRIDGLFALLGAAIGGFLTWYAYYCNSHVEAKRISELAYLILFPPSIGLTVTENASSLGQVTIVFMVVAANAALYGSVSTVLRKLLRRRVAQR